MVPPQGANQYMNLTVYFKHLQSVFGISRLQIHHRKFFNIHDDEHDMVIQRMSQDPADIMYCKAGNGVFERQYVPRGATNPTTYDPTKWRSNQLHRMDSYQQLQQSLDKKR